jgi:MFS family permease
MHGLRLEGLRATADVRGLVSDGPAGAPAGPRRRALAQLAVALVLAMSTWFSASAVIPELEADWGLGEGAAAWLTIAVQLGFVFGALVAAVLNVADVVRPQRVILFGAVAAAAANGLLLVADGPEAAIPLRFLTGAALAQVYPPALKVMSTWYQRGRGAALGVVVGALTVGSALPHFVNGLGGVAWEPVIGATSALTLAGGVIAVSVPDGPFPFPRARFDPRQAHRAIANRGVRLASLGYFGHMWELYAMWAWFVVFFGAALQERGQETGSAAAFATFAVIAIGGLGCWVGGVLGDRWGRTRTTALMMAISGTCAASIGLLFGDPTALVLLVGLIWGFTVVADSAQFSTMVTELADQAYVGTALTLQLALGFTLTVATIWLLPLFEDAVSWRWAFLLLAPGPALGIIAMLRLQRLPEARLIAHGRG